MISRLVALLLLLEPFTGIVAQRLNRFYDPGDWVSYTNTRYITSIARGFNTVYFGTTGGILRYDIRNSRWLDPLTTSDGMPENWIRKLAVDRLTDEIWIETPHMSAYYNPTFDEWIDIQPFPASKIQPPGIRISDLPLLFTDFGYTYYPQGVLVDRNLMEYPIGQLLRDDVDIVWMGIWGLGPGRGDLRRNDLQLLLFGLYDADVAYLDCDGDDVWFLGGSDGLPGTITHFNYASNSWEYFQPRRESGIISDQFSALAHDDRNIWIGTDLGLVRLDKESRRFQSYSHFDGIYGEKINALLPIKDNLLIGTEEGVSVFDLVRDTIYAANSPAIRGRPVYGFAVRARTIYAATEYGIFCLQWGSGQWSRLPLPFPDIRGRVFGIEVVDSFLYAAGDDGVAVVNLNDNSMDTYDRNVKFHNASLTTLLVHQGVVWVGGGDGLFRLNGRTGNWYRYTPSDGLIGQKITSLAGDGDHVWIGTDRGASRFHWKAFTRYDWLQ